MSGEPSMTNGITKLIIKDSIMTTLSSTEDMGFCSGEDFYMENEVHSPTDSSEDSLEVKIGPISLKNKRKLFEPRKTDGIFTGPLKKRMCLKVKAEAAENTNNISTPFRPWSPPQSKIIVPTSTATSRSNNSSDSFVVPYPVKQEVVASPSPSSYFRPPSPLKYYETQSEPVSLVIKKRETDNKSEDNYDIRVPVHPQVTKLSTAETERIILKTTEQFPALKQKQIQQEVSKVPEHASVSSSSSGSNKIEQRREQRNYKNMTRERRIEANARERTRVHTISAAFETLRRSVPAYSHNQKLSKLSVLRIACSYIMTLASLVDSDDDNSETTAECVESVSRTIQREGKLRKKKDDND